MQSPLIERWARIGPSNQKWLTHIPRAGLCLSSFVVATRDDGSILFGLPKASSIWAEKAAFPVWQASKFEREEAWLLPATHLLMEESPDHSAQRIAREWAGLEGRRPTFVMVQSHLRPFRMKPSDPLGNHWDICFVYEVVEAGMPRKIKPWWSRMRFVPRTEIRDMKIGRGHLDILAEAGYFRPSKRENRENGPHTPASVPTAG